VRVHAYEPFPDNVSWLLQNVEESGLTNVEVHQQAVAGKSGVRLLQIDPSDWIMHSLFERGADTGEGLPVECISFDEVVNGTATGGCDLLKIDCEGSEYEILQGCAPETLRLVKRIVGEYHEGPHLNGTGRDLCRFLESRSFRIDRFESYDAICGVFCARNTAAEAGSRAGAERRAPAWKLEI